MIRISSYIFACAISKIFSSQAHSYSPVAHSSRYARQLKQLTIIVPFITSRCLRSNNTLLAMYNPLVLLLYFSCIAIDNEFDDNAKWE